MLSQRRLLVIALIGLLAALQYRLWLGDGGMLPRHRLQVAVDQATRQDDALGKRNSALQAEVDDLGKGGQAIEARARSELGMIRNGETFYLVVQRN
ncbi:MAG TPA: cell division protein FtsB [Castellaniella sp.]|uniref:cell division protein FtsB n=1 Tax=Castellaniella sp. TaxID=1955812 RepID=UPI002EE5152C